MNTLITAMNQTFPPLKQWVIPSYQRNYVWTEEGQWTPLWEDLMALTERVREADSGGADAEPHFLGTIITKHSPSFKPGRLINYWWVVDGQQRLTTLQLLMAAARAAFIQHGLDNPASMLSGVLAEAAPYVGGPGDNYKIRHKSSKTYEGSDYDVFRTVIDFSLSAPSSGAPSGSPLGDCYNYFRGRADAWLRPISEDDRGDAATAFSKAVLKKLVVADIQLSQGQNSHAIFEALNARGEPLTEWEKTKNYILSLAVAKDDPDGDLTYREHLERYDAESYWRGHTDMFLLYFAWLEVPRARQLLVSGREPPKAERLRMNRLYREFRYVGEHLYRDDRTEFAMMLRRLRRYADIYREIDEGRKGTDGGFSGYALKVMGRRHILNLRSLVPVLMILVDRLGRGPELDRVLRIVDSYLMRRIALKGRYRDFDSVAFSLVQALRDTDEEDLGSVVLSRLVAIRGWNWWPRDDEVTRHFQSGDMYHGISSGRLRLLLAGIAEQMHRENLFDTTEFAVAEATVEHIAPQRWQQHWADVFDFDGSDEDAGRISGLVHRIGNLTVVSYNSSLSNSPWTAKKELLGNDNLEMNRRLLRDMQGEVWNEPEIDRRSMQLAGYVNRLWPHAEVLAKELDIELPVSSAPRAPETVQREPTNTNTLYAEFYKPLVARLRPSGVEPVGKGGWRGRWRSFQTGHPDAVYGMGIGEGKATVFLHLSGTDRQQRYRALLQHREEVAGKVDGTILWQEGEFEVTLAREETISLTAPEAELETARRWMADNLIALRNALQPHLEQPMRAGDTPPDAAEGID